MPQPLAPCLECEHPDLQETIMRRTAPVATVIGLGLVLSLTGCFANPLDQITEGIVEGGVEQIIEDQTGVDVDVDGTGASLPDGWPTEIPVPAGNIVASAAVDGTFFVTLETGSFADAEAGYQNIVANGFTESSSFDLGNNSKSFTADNGTLSIAYLLAENEDGTATVQMTVTPVTQ